MTATSQQQFLIDVIDRVSTGAFTRQQAQRMLQCSESSLFRYLRAYRSQGPRFAFHGNQGRAPVNRTDRELEARVKQLMEEHYFDFNLTHAREKLAQEHGIQVSREVFRQWCQKWNMVKRAKKRRAGGKARYKRERLRQEGLMLQMDGSPHRWFGTQSTCLIGAIDDATSRIPYAEFFHSEDTLSCMRVLQKIIEKEGLFEVLYVDRAGLFGGGKRQNFSQVKRALEELGVQILFAHSPEAKGRIERLWGTLQDRLVPEMRLRNIHNFRTANDFLQNQFIPNEWTQKFTRPAANPERAYRKVPEHLDLREIFCLKELRQVNRDHTVSWNGVIYSLVSPVKYSIAKQKIELRTYPDLTWRALYAGQPLELTPLPAGLPASAANALRVAA